MNPRRTLLILLGLVSIVMPVAGESRLPDETFTIATVQYRISERTYLSAEAYEASMDRIVAKAVHDHDADMVVFPEYINIFTNKGLELAYDSRPEDLEVIKVPHAIFSELEK